MKVTNYFDEFGRIHEKKDKECNNANLFTAVYLKLVLLTDTEKYKEKYREVEQAFNSCIKNLSRHPYDIKPEPPNSHDELIGLSIYDGKKVLEALKKNNWKTSHYVQPEFNLFQFIGQLISLIIAQLNPKLSSGDKRNMWWEFKMSQIYFITTHFPLKYRHIIYKNAGEYNWFYDLLYCINNLFPRNKSEQLFAFTFSENNYDKVRAYFEEGHPIVELCDEVSRRNKKVN